jgi:hypothetical protein
MNRKKVWFVAPALKHGTAVLRGGQVVRELKRYGIDSGMCKPRDVRRIRESAIVFVKHLEPEYVECAKNNGNTIIWDMLDGYDKVDRVRSFGQAIDGIIFSTKGQLEDFGGYFSPLMVKAVIYHHFDTRLPGYFKEHEQSKQFNLAYIGLPPDQADNVSHIKAIPGISVIPTDTKNAKDIGWMKKLSPFNCHYNVRNSMPQSRYKPLAKIAVAAACNSNIIANRNSAAQELLGEKYPYLTEPALETVVETIRKARETFGSAEWNAGLEIMAVIKERLSLSSQISEYRRFFNELG